MSNEVLYRGRRAVQAENEAIRVTVTAEGGHIAELLHKKSGINPLWTPPWDSIEPSQYRRDLHPQFGPDAEANLIAGLMGHNLCMDTFGAPSPEEMAAGMPVHGEAPVVPWKVAADANTLRQSAVFPLAQMRMEREIRLAAGSAVIQIDEALENLSPTDRAIAWTQHVTLGPPFLERGATEFRMNATQSKVLESEFNGGLGKQMAGAEFAWPLCPLKDGGVDDLSVFSCAEASGGFTAHLMNPEDEHAYFLAWSPRLKLAVGYAWQRADFPWLGRWEENCLRTQTPWNGRTIACGMEFGVSPMLEARRAMVERGTLFGVPAYRWLPAKSRVAVRYCAFVMEAMAPPASVHWNGNGDVHLALQKRRI